MELMGAVGPTNATETPSSLSAKCQIILWSSINNAFSSQGCTLASN